MIVLFLWMKLSRGAIFMLFSGGDTPQRDDGVIFVGETTLRSDVRVIF